MFNDFCLMSCTRYCLLFGTDAPPFSVCLDVIKSGATEKTKVFQSQCFPFERCMSLYVLGFLYVMETQICLYVCSL